MEEGNTYEMIKSKEACNYNISLKKNPCYKTPSESFPASMNPDHKTRLSSSESVSDTSDFMDSRMAAVGWKKAGVTGD